MAVYGNENLPNSAKNLPKCCTKLNWPNKLVKKFARGAKLLQIWSHWSWLVRKANPCKTILAKVVQFSYKDGIIWITSLNIICFANSKCIWAFWQLALFYHQPRVLKYCLIILVFSNITYLQVRIVVCQSPTYLPTYVPSSHPTCLIGSFFTSR